MFPYVARKRLPDFLVGVIQLTNGVGKLLWKSDLGSPDLDFEYKVLFFFYFFSTTLRAKKIQSVILFYPLIKQNSHTQNQLYPTNQFSTTITCTSGMILPYPRGVEFYGEEVIVLPLASIASLFVVELRSRLPLNGCM